MLEEVLSRELQEESLDATKLLRFCETEAIQRGVGCKGTGCSGSC